MVFAHVRKWPYNWPRNFKVTNNTHAKTIIFDFIVFTHKVLRHFTWKYCEKKPLFSIGVTNNVSRPIMGPFSDTVKNHKDHLQKLIIKLHLIFWKSLLRSVLLKPNWVQIARILAT